MYQSRRFRAGRGKMRNRRRIMKRGPLIIYNEDNGVRRAFRNVPGVSSICVTRLNLLRLAPGELSLSQSLWLHIVYLT